MRILPFKIIRILPALLVSFLLSVPLQLQAVITKSQFNSVYNDQDEEKYYNTGKKTQTTQTKSNSKKKYTTKKQKTVKTTQKKTTAKKSSETASQDGTQPSSVKINNQGSVYSGENIPGISSSDIKIKSNKNNSSNLSEQNVKNSASGGINPTINDSSSLTNNPGDSDVSNSGLSKNMSAYGTGQTGVKNSGKSDPEMEDDSFKYSRHILISILVLVFIIFRLKSGSRKGVLKSRK